MYSYSEVIGHEQVIDHFKNSIKLDKVAHAYIINGEKGSGKKLLSYTYAKTLQCEEKGIEPCGHCTSCLQLESSNHPDIITLIPEKQTSIGVEDIRSQINSDIYIKPYSSRYKIYVIDNAETMTVQAQNALLKTIEEPPSYAIIFLLTNNINLVLPTIISRCIVLNIRPIETSKVKKYLMEKCHLPDYQAELCSNFSQGIIGRALVLSNSEEFSSLKKACLSILNRINSLDVNEIIASIKEFEQYKAVSNEMLDLMITWYRDMLVLKSTNNSELLIYKDEYNSLLKLSQEVSYNNINKNIEAIEEAKQQLIYNVNFDLVIEMMLLKIKGE